MEVARVALVLLVIALLLVFRCWHSAADGAGLGLLAMLMGLLLVLVVLWCWQWHWQCCQLLSGSGWCWR